MTESKKALELVKAGRFEELERGTNHLIGVAGRMGDINLPKGSGSTSAIDTHKYHLGIINNPKSSAQEIDASKRALGGKAKVGTFGASERIANAPGQTDIVAGSEANIAGAKAGAVEDIKTTATGKRGAVKIATDFAKSSNEKIGGLKDLNTQYQAAIDELDKGANTGIVYNMLPSFDTNAMILDNIASQAGFDLAKSGGGIITEADMDWGMRTAIPQNLPPKELKEFLIKKQKAQTKIINHLREVTMFLGDGTKTLSDWYRKQDAEKKSRAKTGALNADEEADIRSKYGV
jgi:hypothetical protein